MTVNRTADEWKRFFLTDEGQEDSARFMEKATTADENDRYRQTPEGIGRYQALEDLYNNRQRPDAFDRAQELMVLPMNQVPASALAFAEALGRKYGPCGEVIHDAYVGYGQYVEGLPNHEGPNAEAEAFFAARNELAASKAPRL